MRAAASVACSVMTIVAACDAASSDPGYGNHLQIAGAQLRPGPFPDATGGPVVASVKSTHATITIGQLREKLHASLAAGATAAIIGLDGDPATWIVRAGPADLDAPDLPTANALYGLADTVAPGPITIEVAAVDASGTIGAPSMLSLVAAAEAPPDGELVISLVWDSSADLDLHVIDPLGHEAWSGHPNTWQSPPPGEPVDPEAWLTGGILDHDGNRGCHRDGAPSEHVIWTTRMGANGPVAPIVLRGQYVVRVDTRSSCKDASTGWYVAAYTTGGVLVAAARGVSIPADAQQLHGAGAGVTALRFTLP